VTWGREGSMFLDFLYKNGVLEANTKISIPGARFEKNLFFLNIITN
jgi:hypothetical protein